MSAIMTSRRSIPGLESARRRAESHARELDEVVSLERRAGELERLTHALVGVASRWVWAPHPESRYRPLFDEDVSVATLAWIRSTGAREEAAAAREAYGECWMGATREES